MLYDMSLLTHAQRKFVACLVPILSRDQQKAFIESRDAPAKGNPWERVYNLVDLNPKAQKSVKDVTRMRSILTQLKTAPNAPGAA